MLSLFFSTQLFAKSGFSLGVFGSYAVDGGSIDGKLDRSQSLISLDSDFDPVIIAGSGLFARYDFSNNLFIRSGVEYNELVSGGDISGGDPSDVNYIKFQIEYNALSFPLFFGINVTPDKGKTNIYGAAGPILAIVESYLSKTEGVHLYETESDSFIFGFGGIFGIEKRITSGFYFMIEYAVYRCESSKKVGIKTFSNGFFIAEAPYVEKYDLPRQQIRLGLRYAF